MLFDEGGVTLCVAEYGQQASWLMILLLLLYQKAIKTKAKGMGAKREAYWL